MIQAGMEFGTNTPYGEYTLILIMLIPLFPLQYGRVETLSACSVFRNGAAQMRRGSEAAWRGREEVRPEHQHPLSQPSEELL